MQANYKTTVVCFLPPSTLPSQIIAVRHVSQSKGFGVETQTKVFLNELVKSK